jgi:tRNA(Ile)-lysidine synthase
MGFTDIMKYNKICDTKMIKMQKEITSLYEKFKSNLIKECGVKRGDKILIGCSGGPDSMAMLHLFHQAAKELDLEIYVSHINYKLRGEASDRDEMVVRETCKSLGLPCETITMKMGKEYQYSNLEETLREFRYREFNQQAKKHNCKWIAIAHNKNDQAETLLLNLIRGAGTEGLSAMSFVKTNRMIIRPMLNIEREEIMKYLKDNNIIYGEDESNYALTFTRNKIRNILLPLMVKEFNPAIVDILYQTSLIIGEEGTLIDEICQRYMKQLADERTGYIAIPIEEFDKLPIAIKRRILRLMYRNLVGNTRRLHFMHLETILKLENLNEERIVLDLPNSVQVGIRKGKIEFYLRGFCDKIKYFEYKVRVPARIEIVEVGKEVELLVMDREQLVGFDSSKKELYLDYEKCESEMIIRNRRAGDMFKALGAPGKKKLKDYLIDKKIPRPERDKLLLLESGGEIACIIGVEINDAYKVSSASRKILCVRINR